MSSSTTWEAQREATGILVAAEAFDDYGGWVLDSQFETVMGAPYLLAHGLGRPVADASTTIHLPRSGDYRVWVRAKDWVPGHHPGRFTLSLAGTTLEAEFGANDADWNWEYAGVVPLAAGPTSVVLSDLTGFDGRCEAIYLALDDVPPPDGAGPDARAWRRRRRGLADEPADAGAFDVVVVGGGITGAAATLAAARLGRRVALVHSRPVLGGNASVEIGLTPRGVTGPLIDELSVRGDDGDLSALEVLRSQPGVSVFLEHTAHSVRTQDTTIVSVDAREARTGVERRFEAPVFIDCTGTAILGLLAGAGTLFGHESAEEYGEGLAPEHHLDEHHGNTVFFRTRTDDEPVPFPEVPWAVEVAKDYADLSGQLSRPGLDNQPGPVAGKARTPDPTVRRRMLFPGTHFWEYGQELDPYTQAEHIRDHLLRAIFGTFSNVKRLEPDTYATLALDWVAFVPGQGEFRRYRGDYVLTETDIREHREFPDAVVQNAGAFCLHYSGNEKYDFRLADWRWDERDHKPFWVPFRCLYSADLDNVLMAGKHISVTHVAGSVTKFMGNGGQHAIAAAAAAALCIEHGTTPRGVGENHLDELKSVVSTLTGTSVGSQKS